ncbi:hypothetical protein ACFWWA_17640 [Streptomyces goshikiensis]|uniref:hypothetical protein n=1 Tax=Streptomyces goshikiensis TaxID=1942 RepID=UPI003668E8AF
MEGKRPGYLVDIGLAEDEDEGEGEAAAFDAGVFRLQLGDRLRAAAAAADSGYPDNESLVIDPSTGIPSLKAHRWEGQRPARAAYWVEW